MVVGAVVDGAASAVGVVACGSAAVIADLVSGKQPAIRADDLAVFRYAGTPQLGNTPELVKA